MHVNFTTTIKELVDAGMLSHRSYNTCIANGIETIRDLDHYHVADNGFLHFRNCGTKTNNELVAVLEQAHENLDPVNASENFIQSLPQDVSDAIKEGIEKFVPYASGSPVARMFHHIYTPDLFIYRCYRERDRILTVADSDFDCVDASDMTIARYELRRRIVNIVAFAYECMANNYDPRVKRERLFLKRLRNAMDSRLHTDYMEGYFDALLTPKKMRLAQRKFEALVNESPRITVNFINKYELSLKQAWSCLNLKEDQFYQKFSTCRKGAQGFMKLLGEFKEYLEYLITSSDDDDNRHEMQHHFPFLNDEDALKAVRYKEKYGNLPMFFITDRYFTSTASRQHNIYAHCFGLGGYQPKRKTEVADELGVSRERVRQIICDSNFSKLGFSDKSLWKHYDFIGRHIICPNYPGWRMAFANEGLQPTFSMFAGIMVAVHGYAYKRLAGVDKFVVLPEHEERYGGYLKKMLDLRDRTHVDDKLVELNEFLTPEDASCHEICQNISVDLARYLEVQVLGSRLFFPHTTVDVVAEVRAMLAAEGNPLHVDDILIRMNRRFPDLHLTKDNLKFQMRSSDDIVPKGKTSRYCLNTWTHIFIGSIRDLVKKILSDSDRPMDMDEIMGIVAENFDTTQYNVYNSLLVSDDFQLYEGSRFGLSGKDYEKSGFKRVGRNSGRKNFMERFAEYKNFVELHGHHPFNGHDEPQSTLKRWQSNILKQNIAVSEENLEEFRHYMEETKGIPFTSTEASFKHNCDKYAALLKEYGVHGIASAAPEMAEWFEKTKQRFQEYHDRRHDYFMELLGIMTAQR